MNSKLIYWVLLIAVTFCFVDPLQAGIVKKGQVGFRFLENPVAAEAIGRGGLGLTLFRNSNAVFWNPAGLGWMECKIDFNANYTKGIAEINYSSFVGAYKPGKFGIMAIDAMIMDYGTFYGTRRANNEQGFTDTGTFSPAAFSLGLTFSQKVSDRFSYGVRLKYAKQDLGDAWVGTGGSDVDDPNLVIGTKSYAHGEPAIDIGAIYDFLAHAIRFGATMQNFSREIKYEDEKFPMPFAVSFSLTVDPLSFFLPADNGNFLLVGFETRHPRDFKEKIKFGAEYLYHDLLIARVGYLGNYDERGITFGVGVKHNLVSAKLRLDYAFQEYGIFNSVHTISFGVSY